MAPQRARALLGLPRILIPIEQRDGPDERMVLSSRYFTDIAGGQRRVVRAADARTRSAGDLRGVW